MGAELLDGRAVAEGIQDEVARAVKAMPVPPGLATVLVGDDAASAMYVRRKRTLCVEAGIRDLHRHLPARTSQAELTELVAELARDPGVSGILVQLPLPAHLDPRATVARIPADKDVDGLTVASAGRLAQREPGLRPCTPSAVIAILDAYDLPIAGAEAVVVGRSDLVGRPLAAMLLERNATVTVCHRGTADLRAVCRRADLLVVAAGVPELIGPDHVRPGAVVVDVGIHRGPGGLRGDVRFDAVAPIASRITPVPGGVGPMTIAMLLRNTVDAARLAQGG
ncbi:MAG TPA: bifunctional 5,10-methylenetetrahydrofolate dehydrogenase/5,10-methenyltetrahydrofolate cyclohydrolase [Rugosimonospora sp.]|nr:bifunctional 5,10-methylenetetrahydrofolate dehydrogenase/5,10-methenyltetrahydrofolate cyclohydrolase [Rugosimonospora sp.]